MLSIDEWGLIFMWSDSDCWRTERKKSFIISKIRFVLVTRLSFSSRHMSESLLLFPKKKGFSLGGGSLLTVCRSRVEVIREGGFLRGLIRGLTVIIFIR